MLVMPLKPIHVRKKKKTKQPVRYLTPAGGNPYLPLSAICATMEPFEGYSMELHIIQRKGNKKKEHCLYDERIQ